jgi:hypothetical protein
MSSRRKISLLKYHVYKRECKKIWKELSIKGSSSKEATVTYKNWKINGFNFPFLCPACALGHASAGLFQKYITYNSYKCSCPVKHWDPDHPCDAYNGLFTRWEQVKTIRSRKKIAKQISELEWLTKKQWKERARQLTNRELHENICKIL